MDGDDGGHIMITPKVRVNDRLQFPPKKAIEVMRLTMVVGQAMIKVMNEHGVDIERINFQENGNWGVFKPEGLLCTFIYLAGLRVPKIQKYGQALYFPHKEENPEFYKNLKSFF